MPSEPGKSELMDAVLRPAQDKSTFFRSRIFKSKGSHIALNIQFFILHLKLNIK